MSTYLVAFLVSDFDYTMNIEENNYKIWHEPSKSKQATYAASIAPRITHFFEEYFNVEYSLPKMDIAAVPGRGGAMENWGLIIFGASRLLFDEENSGAWDKQMIVRTLAHEIGHMWFGDLVTMKWWNELWLNEGNFNFSHVHWLKFSRLKRLIWNLLRGNFELVE